MEKILVILFNLLIIVGIVMIFLYFRLDRMAMNADLKWKAVYKLLREYTEEEMNRGIGDPAGAEDAAAFVKCRKQDLQVQYACRLKGTVIAPGKDPELTRRCRVYNEAAQMLKDKCSRQPWQFISVAFRVKERRKTVEF